ncbi:hypothetical protein HGP17_11735 [Rhizobium sp. P38BS-XIX]|uniref:hypothetical protein n=1 Tax=Rhizobium sp. P38BS-XIX TaxID=2726740 RepID=UPI0014577F4D|nr:hypothetical protein [Rhizobium sp. P38BS-XIX]NLR97486.1 hypothetical protein [Rhizobium sp. P38BS-XIX]
MHPFGPISTADKKPTTPPMSSNHARPNLMRQAQVIPPHQVDLTLAPTTLEQIRAPSEIIDHKKHKQLVTMVYSEGGSGTDAKAFDQSRELHDKDIQVP